MIEPVTGARVVLREVSAEDLPAIGAWYTEAAATALGAADELRARLKSARQAGGGLAAITRAGEGQVIGLVEYRIGTPEPGWVSVPFIALAAGQRGWGYGSEAVRLLESELMRAGKGSRFAGEAPLGNGLSVYFWLRLGYRPMDGVRKGVLGMVREVG